MSTSAWVLWNGKAGTQEIPMGKNETLVDFINRLYGYLVHNKNIWKIEVEVCGEKIFVVCLFGKHAHR